MANKRKCTDDAVPTNAKQIKLDLIPFPSQSGETDAEMADVEIHTQLHPRLRSNSSSNSSGSSLTHSPLYSTTELHLLTSNSPVYSNYHSYPGYDRSPTTSTVGLIQPEGGFTHHGAGCTQIPKLRVACASGVNNQRSMWAHCEQCGAISMVDSNDS